VSPANPSDYRKPDTSLMQLVESGRSLSGLERNCCFLNLHQGRFADVSAVSGLDFQDDGRAIGLFDWDFDGKVDMWLVNRSGPQVRLLRNDSPPGHHFLSLKLRGTASNRDAIGAHVLLHLKGEELAPQMRTLRAGDGFLSQSSKWLHFGLGAATDIERVVVRWPGGKSEEFTGLSADGHYLLTQGSGQAAAARPAAVAQRKPLAAAPLPLTDSPIPPRSVLGTRFRAPRLDYLTFDEKPQVVQSGGKPTLLVLWGSTCVPCGQELKDLEARREQLASAGLQVVALATDGVALAADGSGRRTKPEDARALAEKLALTMPTGLADARLLAKLQLMLDAMFGRDLPIGLPYSFLFDAQGQLAVIYRGRLAMDDLLADVRLLPLAGTELRNAALPFAGRWANMPEADYCLHIARRLLDEDLDPEHAFIEANKARLSKDADYARLLGYVADQELRKGNEEAALAWSGQALAVDPKLVAAHHLRGIVHYRASRWGDAAAAFWEATKADDKHLASQANLAWILATSHDEKLRNGKEAVQRAELVFRSLHAPQPQVFDLLAAAYACDGRFDEAVSTLDRALVMLGRLYAQAEADEAGEQVLQRLRESLLLLEEHRQRFLRRQALYEAKPHHLGSSPFAKE
jgi:tetratricopeptide (TPR) repeat protein